LVTKRIVRPAQSGANTMKPSSQSLVALSLLTFAFGASAGQLRAVVNQAPPNALANSASAKAHTPGTVPNHAQANRAAAAAKGK
jgi:hypothetical protein